jgi:hypothetical protein
MFSVCQLNSGLFPAGAVCGMFDRTDNTGNLKTRMTRKKDLQDSQQAIRKLALKLHF